MNVSGNFGQTAQANVVPLFAKIQINHEVEVQETSAAMDWDLDVDLKDETIVAAPRITVRENQFPDQSMFVLNDQILKLKENIDRLKFYLNDVDDLLPRR
jgi:hypothetical protein